MTLADRLRPPFARATPRAGPSAAAGTLLYDATLVLGASLLLALSAQVAVPLLPFSPVPITGQTLALFLMAAALGRARAVAATVAYLAEGAAGMPVFAGGAGGAYVLLGPSGGYLAGFLPAAWIVGSLSERGFDRRFGTTALAMLAGNAAVWFAGLAWLARFTGPSRAVALGFTPFFPGDILKIAAAAALLPLAWKVLGRRG
jgi:biotin transport system substrate-specific component